jgi:uncharacterized membrane protein YbhN (UPF0104 family)
LSLDSEPSVVVCAVAAPGSCASRRKLLVSVGGAVAVAAVLSVVLARRHAEFVTALHSASPLLLVVALLLQIVALLARSEAWNVCVRAAGGSVTRRTLFRAAGIGCLASVVNGSVGMAARITSLRRAAPQSTPRVPALVAAEVPIITVEVALAAIFSFTLVSTLGAPWWAPVIAVVTVAGALFGMRRFSERHPVGVWSGLAVMRHKARTRMVAFTLLAVCAQVIRNWLMLHAIGEDVSIFDAMALLIAMFTLGQLPVGPSIGPAAAVLILGAHGVASSAAAGVLLAATGIAGSLCYASWALGDRLVGRRSDARQAAAVRDEVSRELVVSGALVPGASALG